ncbi:MAG: YSC84-related protein [Pseudomonadota bacterium]
MSFKIPRGMPRRQFLGAGAAFAGLAGCANGVGNENAFKIDQASDAAINFLYSSDQDAANIASRASGILIMPQITEASFLFGGSFGTGSLRVQDATVDYYSATQATVGLSIGAQQYSHALFFMSDAALENFRASDGWAAGADIRYAADAEGQTIGFDSTQINTPVIAYVFAQAGAIVGATLEGTKYTRIIP